MTQQMDALDRARSYGVRMNEPLGSVAEIQDMQAAVDHNVHLWLDDPRLAKVVRLRMIGYNRRDYPWWDVSYCYGQLKEGTDITLAEGKKFVRVSLPIERLGRFWQKQLVEWGRENKVFVKALGIFDADVVSQLYG